MDQRSCVSMRAIFILLGALVLQRFHWVSYLFGAFLVVTGTKLLVQRSAEVHPERNPLFRLFQRIVPSVDHYRNEHFTLVESGKRYATPLLLLLVTIEATDIVFAVDSIPAIFAVTGDPFIVYTSNIFAVLGLRALYFALAGVIGKLQYLKVGLSLVLAFVGTKMLLAPVYKIPIVASRRDGPANTITLPAALRLSAGNCSASWCCIAMTLAAPQT
jgi:tellurite resistance protein TerC